MTAISSHPIGDRCPCGGSYARFYWTDKRRFVVVCDRFAAQHPNEFTIDEFTVNHPEIPETSQSGAQ